MNRARDRLSQVITKYPDIVFRHAVKRNYTTEIKQCGEGLIWLWEQQGGDIDIVEIHKTENFRELVDEFSSSDVWRLDKNNTDIRLD